MLDSFADLVSLYGHLPALEDEGRSLDFQAIWGLTAQIAGQIAAASRSSGPIGILLPADARYYPAVLACLAAGRPSVLLDPTVPAARNAELLRQTGASLVLQPPEQPDSIPGDAASVLVLDQQQAAGAPQPLKSPLGLDEPALIMCTSGSTGRPKAIVHSQRTLMHRAWSHCLAVGVQPNDICLSLASPAILSGLNGFLTFAMGGGATRLLDLRAAGIARLLEILETRSATSLRASPSVLRLLTKLPGISGAMAGLRNVTALGEPMSRADVEALRACLPASATILTGYGSTESGTLLWHASLDDSFDPIRTPAGRLMPGTEAAIIDDDGRCCGPGEVGELVLRSRANALGEWQAGGCVPGQLVRDEADPTLRIHWTGDLARRTPEGVYVVLGRKDRMLKVNGQRIEPSEIEAAIRRAATVMECAVVVQAREPSSMLVAYVVLRDAVAPTALDELRASLHRELPTAMVPSRFIAVARLPLLPGGKVDLLTLSRQSIG